MSDPLASLVDVLDRLARPVQFWWRDDDAGRHDPALDRLLDLAAGLELPLMLAVVPAWLDRATEERIRRSYVAAVFQHGWAHADHGAGLERKIELGGGVNADRLANDLAVGSSRLAAAFHGQFHPVMVPPWNRIDAVVERLLPPLGFRVLSATPPEPGSIRPTTIPRRDIHLDVMTWGETPSMLPMPSLARDLVATIGAGDSGPIGIMTHHQVTDDSGFEQLGSLLGTLARHRHVRFATAADLVQV